MVNYALINALVLRSLSLCGTSQPHSEFVPPVPSQCSALLLLAFAFSHFEDFTNLTYVTCSFLLDMGMLFIPLFSSPLPHTQTDTNLHEFSHL